MFALVLLPIYKKVGVIPTVLVASAVGIIPNLLLNHRFDVAHFSFLALFGFGMAGAEVNFSTRFGNRKWPWGWISAGFGALFLLYFSWHGNHGNVLILDFLLGGAAATLIIAITRTSQKRLTSPILSVLSLRYAVMLGTFSYSVYLVHDPMLYSLITVMRSYGLGAQVVKPVLLASVPVVIGIAYLFHLAFERPFLSKPGTKIKTERQAEIAAIFNPAP